MRVAVIGAGIAGVTTAYELTADGHAVTVLERHSSVAAEGSFAPTGLTGAGWWALAPQAEGTRPSLGAALLRAPGLWPWWWKQRRSDAPAAAVRRLAASIPLAQQGHERLQALIVRLGVELEQSHGTLVLWRDASEHSRAQPALTALRALGVVATELDTAGCHALEPHLDTQHALAGGIHLPGTDSVNCRQFAHALREAAEQAGADFRFATTVRAIVPEAGGGVTLRLEQTAPTTGFGSSRMVPTRLARPVPPERARAAARYLEPLSDERYDAVVVAAGAAASRLLEPLGLHLAMATVHGYTLTAALRSPERGPRSAVVDVAEGAVIGRLGQRVRIAAGAELGGSPQRLRNDATERLYRLLQHWFPGAAQLTRPQIWKGPRAVSADGLPLVGAGPRPDVWLNLGHGGTGWSLACGSAQRIADLVAGRAPQGLADLQARAA
ncbi:MAG TPA: FAD-dependent oxidoreductase [Methylibium sp.]|nr:FAD-dependent oxidoreductase [Methylibium sp.]